MCSAPKDSQRVAIEPALSRSCYINPEYYFMSLNRFCAALSISVLAINSYAVEGMWQPHQVLDLAADMQAKGLQLDPKKLADLNAHPLNAVVSLGFCTASFVSPMGLVVTNHHCGYGTIQYNSKPENNLLKNGFLARTIGEELPGEPTLRVYVTKSITDVTAAMRKDLPKQGRARYDEIDRRQKAYVANCEKDPGHRCDVYVFHGGATYFVVKQMEIRDVRLVYAPPEAIGKFGGDTDNWIWPRHTGDFAFLRAYVGPNGQAADYAPTNVPYRPKSYLKVAQEGVKDGDFVMIAGYPGRTNRYRMAEEMNDAASWTYPNSIARVHQLLNVIASNTAGRPDAVIKYAATVASLNNGVKNAEGNRDGFAKFPAVAIKTDEQQKILDWAAKHEVNALANAKALSALIAKVRATRDRDQLLGYMAYSGLFSAARDIYRSNIERDKADAEREYGYQERDQVRIEGRLRQLDKRFDAKADQAILAYVISEYQKLDADQRMPALDQWLGEQPSARLDAMYRETTLGDVEARVRLFKAGRKAIESASDPALQMIVAVMPSLLEVENNSKSIRGTESMLRPAWMDARLAYAKSQGKPIYPDANSSLRLTYGNVMGYSPRDAVRYAPFTYLDGIVEKNTGTGEFDATQKQLEKIKARTHANLPPVPVNFLSDLDITGGNSGSPTINAKGELVGLAFDGNYEAISSGWIFNPKLTRTIHVDSRYMLWLMQEVDGANNLIKEMEK
jgi:hypothetical protein